MRSTLVIGDSSASTGRAVLDGRPAGLEEAVVERPVEPVVLGSATQCRSRRRATSGGGQDRARGRGPSAFQWSTAAGRVEQVDPADGLLERPQAQGGQVLADLLGDELEEGLDELGRAGEALAQLGVLGGDAHRAGVEVADPHHDAARHDQRGGGEAELLGPEQGADDHVAAGLQLAVHLDHDAVAQPVEHQGLLGLGQAELPGDPGVLDRRQRGWRRCRRRGPR